MKVLRTLTFPVMITALIASTICNADPVFASESSKNRFNDSAVVSHSESFTGSPAGIDNSLVNLQPACVASATSLSLPRQQTMKNLGEVNQGAETAFWVIDTRCVSHSAIRNPQESLAQVRFFAVNQCGSISTLSSDDWITNAEDTRRLWLVVHGNRIDSGEAVVFMRAFRRTADQLGLDGQFVLWSWPSEEIVRGIARDSRLKAARADLEASLLASWLARHRIPGPVVLVGYSFGARTVLRAIAQLQSEKQSAGSENVSAISDPNSDPEFVLFLIAPAIDAATFDRFVDQVIERGVRLRIVVTVNRSDPALRWYRHLWTCHGPDALGWQRPYCRTVQNLNGSLKVLNVTRQVGHTHRWETYLLAPAIRHSFQMLDSVSLP